MALGALNGVPDVMLEIRNSERGSENTPELSECYSEIQTLRNPPPLLRFLVVLGGNAVRFFPALCFGESPELFCHFCRVLPFLGFLCGGFFETSSGAREGRGESWFFVGKMLYFR